MSSMKEFAYLTCFAVLINACLAHVCLVSPHQRGSMTGLNKPASHDCIRLDGPCGGKPKEVPHTVYKAGGNFTAIFQKNLNHWLKSTPGYFSVSLMKNDEDMPKELARVNDHGEKSLTLYTVSGTIPMGSKGLYILQVRYVTKNTKAPAVFYQCADIYIYSNNKLYV